MESSGASTETRFNSITPLILKLRDLIFGTQRPDLVTRILCYLNLIIWLIFFVWHLIGFTAISLREVILVKKKIDVEALIFERGEALGFKPYEFLNLLMKYHLISSICWAVVFIGIVMMWRRKRIFALFLFGAAGVYFAQIFLLMGWNYFMQDTTWFDKIALGMLVVNSFIFLLFMPRKAVLYDDEVE